jgi:hypothetical protein
VIIGILLAKLLIIKVYVFLILEGTVGNYYKALKKGRDHLLMVFLCPLVGGCWIGVHLPHAAAGVVVGNINDAPKSVDTATSISTI